MATKMQERREYDVGGYHYYIAPFTARQSIHCSGDVLNIIVPIVSAVLPMLNMVSDPADGGEGGISLMDMDMGELGDMLTKGFAGIDGKVCDRLFDELIFAGNVAVDFDGKTQRLEDVADEVFCFNGVNAYIVLWDVVMVNYGGFLKGLVNRSGSATKGILTRLTTPKNTEN